MKQKYRVVQTKEDRFVIQERFLFFWIAIEVHEYDWKAIKTAERLQRNFEFKKKVIWP